MTKTDALSLNGSQKSLPEGMSRSKDDYTMNLENCLKQLKFTKTHKISGYTSITIPIKYIPNEIGPF